MSNIKFKYIIFSVWSLMHAGHLITSTVSKLIQKDDIIMTLGIDLTPEPCPLNDRFDDI